MPITALAGGAGIGLASGVIGAVTAGSAQAQAQQAAMQAAQQYLALTVPDPAEQQVILEHFKNTGEMDPRLATAFQQAQSQMSKISTNPAEEQAQLEALASLENIGSNGGRTLAQDAYLNNVRNQVNEENAGRQGAIQNQFAARGMGQPSGLMLSAEEQNNQNMTQKENDASMQAAEQAQQSALQALQEQGQLGGQIRNQDFSQAANVAQAQDAINRFNTQMNQDVENQNVGYENQANQYNVKNAQNIANENTQLDNQQQMYNKGLIEQQYENELQKAGGAAAGYAGEAGQYNTQAQTDANMWGNIGQGLTKTGAGFAQYLNDQQKKENQNQDQSSSS